MARYNGRCGSGENYPDPEVAATVHSGRRSGVKLGFLRVVGRLIARIDPEQTESLCREHVPCTAEGEGQSDNGGNTADQRRAQRPEHSEHHTDRYEAAVAPAILKHSLPLQRRGYARAEKGGSRQKQKEKLEWGGHVLHGSNPV